MDDLGALLPTGADHRDLQRLLAGTRGPHVTLPLDERGEGGQALDADRGQQVLLIALQAGSAGALRHDPPVELLALEHRLLGKLCPIGPYVGLQPPPGRRLNAIMYVTLYVTDQDRALDFCTRQLELEKRIDCPNPDGCFLAVGVPGGPVEIVLWSHAAAAGQPAGALPDTTPGPVFLKSDDLGKADR
ncbi:hypothetical protein [Kitasatospora sp. NPDC051914]|uniref:hypothetical protein n=1 Tax=Kitasatospora sp. NPDC051914 TaxID=3154945 RepID=UPI00343FC26A